jgi:hypothetical protein
MLAVGASGEVHAARGSIKMKGRVGHPEGVLMRRCSLLMVALVAGCTSEPTASRESGGLRQPLPMVMPFPLFQGRTTGAQLGTSLDPCGGGGFVAGAPGDNSALLVTDGGAWFESPVGILDGGAVGVSVVCDGPVSVPRVVTAGDLGVFHSTLLAGWVKIKDGGVEVIARGSSAISPLLVAEPSSGTVSVYNQLSGYTLASSIPGAQGMGSALVWHPAGTYFAAGNPRTATVRLTGWDTNANTTTSTTVLQGPTGSGFGAALAIGDVHPNPGAELIVGTPGTAQVFIYGEGMGAPPLLMVLDALAAAAGSFGLSLAVERLGTTATLNGLWVGDPFNDSLMRFIGDAGETLDGPTVGASFGSSLAVSGSSLVIGAPLYSDVHFQSGAIFKVPLDPAVVNGTPMLCDVREDCFTPTCEVGRCLGGVACLPAGRLCPLAVCVAGMCPSDGGMNLDAGSDAGSPPDAGTTNAGTTDAGNPDAGNPDAGSPDAGSPDAGSPDAGSPDSGVADAGLDGGTITDGGTPLDGGVTDAGTNDAGEPLLPDGGVAPAALTFTTCGCSGIGAVPLVLLSMLLGRRRSAQR